MATTYRRPGAGRGAQPLHRTIAQHDRSVRPRGRIAPRAPGARNSSRSRCSMLVIRLRTPALVIIDLAHPQAFGHLPSLDDRHPRQEWPTEPSAAGDVTCYGTSESACNGVEAPYVDTRRDPHPALPGIGAAIHARGAGAGEDRAGRRRCEREGENDRVVRYRELAAQGHRGCDALDCRAEKLTVAAMRWEAPRKVRQSATSPGYPPTHTRLNGAVSVSLLPQSARSRSGPGTPQMATGPPRLQYLGRSTARAAAARRPEQTVRR